jgi:hypothetical protein
MENLYFGLPGDYGRDHETRLGQSTDYRDTIETLTREYREYMVVPALSAAIFIIPDQNRSNAQILPFGIKKRYGPGRE